MTPRLHQAARLVTSQRLRTLYRPRIFQVFTAAAVSGYDEFLTVAAQLGERYGIRIRPREMPFTREPSSTPPWTQEWELELAADTSPTAQLARELLGYLSPSGILPDTDETLAGEIGASLNDIRDARNYLMNRLKIGYSSTLQYWMAKAGHELTLIEKQMLNRLDQFIEKGIHAPDVVKEHLESEGYSYNHLRELGIALTRRFGNGPVTPSVPLPSRTRTSVDIQLFREPGGGLSATYNMPTVQPISGDAATATLSIDPEARKDIWNLIQACLDARLKALKTAVSFILRYNTDFLLGISPYRRNVPFREFRQSYAGRPKYLYPLLVDFETRRYTVHELVGYDRDPTSGYILHFPLKDILHIRERNPSIPVLKFRSLLKDYGIHVPKTTLYRLLNPDT